VIGRTILHYTITAELGAGAMGRVYLAKDERTERRVALKFVAAGAPGVGEARASSGRNERGARQTEPGGR